MKILIVSIELGRITQIKTVVKKYVSDNLTRRRYLLLCKAEALIKDSESIVYVFADVNCSLGTQFENGVFKNFNDENELFFN